jgi:hypothetical protein
MTATSEAAVDTAVVVKKKIPALSPEDVDANQRADLHGPQGVAVALHELLERLGDQAFGRFPVPSSRDRTNRPRMQPGCCLPRLVITTWPWRVSGR